MEKVVGALIGLLAWGALHLGITIVNAGINWLTSLGV